MSTLLTRNQIVMIMEKEALKHRKIAQKSRIHPVTLSRYLNGHSELKPENLRALSAVLARYIE
ncbi:helix-turn-helix domain-containing protein [Aneurinibacillus sp. UBA3580]|uniref:helix-turn-helix domain-containing protein n=1 Tax=Aneurinibacillus sp. UBA3580 TaxID=1946041 RepID=UPI00257CED97|nr:helix-turn-helix transcriptional regulator [Aneurinibacillus sp. UBA3580]